MIKTGKNTRFREEIDGKFRLRTKKFILTYSKLPNLDDLEEQVLMSFEEIFGLECGAGLEYGGFNYLIVREAHKTGEPHIHAFLEFDSVQNIYAADKLDIRLNLSNNEEQIFHGNYQSSRSKSGSIKYLLKSVSDYKSLKTNMKLPVFDNKFYTNMEDHLFDVTKEEGLDKAIEVLYEFYPQQMVKQGSSIIRNLMIVEAHTENLRPDIPPKFKTTDFVLSPILTNWVKEDKMQNLIMFGPSGTGKTELAKSITHLLGLKTLFVREKEALKKFGSYHKAIIFDDLNLSKFEREELINLTDMDNNSQVRCLYGTVFIPARTLKIFTTNLIDPYLAYGKVITRRVLIVEIPKLLPAPTVIEPITAGDVDMCEDVDMCGDVDRDNSGN